MRVKKLERCADFWALVMDCPDCNAERILHYSNDEINKPEWSVKVARLIEEPCHGCGAIVV